MKIWIFVLQSWEPILDEYSGRLRRGIPVYIHRLHGDGTAVVEQKDRGLWEDICMRYGRGKGILIIFFLILSVLFLILLGTEIFAIHKITVLGNRNIEYNEIVKLSGIEIGENIFKLDVKRVEENLKSNPYIAV